VHICLSGAILHVCVRACVVSGISFECVRIVQRKHATKGKHANTRTQKRCRFLVRISGASNTHQHAPTQLLSIIHKLLDSYGLTYASADLYHITVCTLSIIFLSPKNVLSHLNDMFQGFFCS